MEDQETVASVSRNEGCDAEAIQVEEAVFDPRQVDERRRNVPRALRQREDDGVIERVHSKEEAIGSVGCS